MNINKNEFPKSFFPDQKVVDRIKKKYKEGKRVKLIRMNDPYIKIPEGTLGTVTGVDDVGTIFVNWDTGHTLGIVYKEDECVLVQ